MDPREKSAELFYSALDLVSRTTGSADSRLSRALGHGADFVGYAKRRRKRSASLEEIFGVLAVTGQPDCVVFGKLFPQPAPAELLRLVCDADPRHRQAEPPLLARVRKVCEGLNLRQLKSAETLAWPRRMILGVIDELRFKHLRLGLLGIEETIESLLVSLACAHKLTPERLGSLAFAISLWGDIQRSAGYAGRGLLACALGLDLAEKSTDRWARARCLWLAAVQMHHLGHSELGLPWLDEASLHFGLEQEYSYLPQLLVTRGILQSALGRKEEAARSMCDALEKLKATDERWRHEAMLQLAILWQEAGRFEEALGHWVELLRAHASRDVHQADLQLWKSAAHLGLGQTSESVMAFGEAVRLLSESGQEAAAAWALCGIARRLLEQGRAQSIGAAVSEVQRAWAKSTLSPRLVRWLEDFFALARLRRFTRADLADLKSRLQEVSPPPVAVPMDLEPVSCSFEIRITLTFGEAEDETGAGDARPEHCQCLL
jgi:tetratricopeptide (TPR) repeat protein